MFNFFSNQKHHVKSGMLSKKSLSVCVWIFLFWIKCWCVYSVTTLPIMHICWVVQSPIPSSVSQKHYKHCCTYLYGFVIYSVDWCNKFTFSKLKKWLWLRALGTCWVLSGLLDKNILQMFEVKGKSGQILRQRLWKCIKV